MAVEVAADLPGLHERRRGVAERLLAQLRRAPGKVERAVDRRLVGRGRQRLERVDVRRRAGGAQRARCRARLRRGGDELDGMPSTVTPTARRPSCSITATICGSSAKRASTGAGSSAARDHREPLAARRRQRRTSPAGSRRPRPRSSPTSSWARQRTSGAAPRLVLRRAPRATAPRVFGPMPGTLRSRPRGGRLAQLLRRLHAERPRDVDRAPRPEPEVAAEPDHPERELGVRARPARRSRRSGRARAAAPRCPARCRAARAPGPVRTSDATGTGAARTDRLGGATVGARAVRVRLGEVEQRRERLQPIGDPGVVHRCTMPTDVGGGEPHRMTRVGHGADTRGPY